MVSVTNVSTGAVVSWSLPLSLLLHSPHSLHCTAALPFPAPTPTAPPSGSRNVERAWSKRGGAVEDVAPEGKPPQMPRKCPQMPALGCRGHANWSHPISLLLKLPDLRGREPHGLLHCAAEPRSTR